MFPKIIFQTWKTNNLPSFCEDSVISWKKLNQNYQYIFHNDDDNRHFVKKYFPQYLTIYNSYHQEIYRADFIRYLFLYKYGGIYADIDSECLKPFNELLLKYKDKNIILGKLETEEISQSIPNVIMISKPKNKFWIDLINNICLKKIDINNFKKEYGPHMITGPLVLKETYDNHLNKNEIELLDSVFFYEEGSIKFKQTTKKIRNNKFFISIKREEVRNKGGFAFTFWMNSWTGHWTR